MIQPPLLGVVKAARAVSARTVGLRAGVLKHISTQ
jgi:hypothetical protein